MRIFRRLQVAIAFLFITGAAIAQEIPPTVADALQRAEIPMQSVGIFVQEVGNGPVLLSANAVAPFNPASTMKLVTTDVALEMLGPAFTWKTQAFMTGNLRHEVLRGDLHIRGGGDPKLVVENLWLFLRRIRAKGIRDIQGDVVLDRSIFEAQPQDAAAFDGDPLKPYNVAPDALLVNFKAVTLRFAPTSSGRAVHVSLDPALAAFPVGAPRIAGGDCGDWRRRLNPVIDAYGIRFAGTYAASCGEKYWSIHPYQLSHVKYFDLVFRKLWAELGGRLGGEVREGGVPDAALPVADWESASLSEVIRDINKYSNNVMARQLLLTLANQVTKLPANTERGGTVVRSWLASKGIDAPELAIDNGSGLSRTERISAGTMGRMLSLAFAAPTMPEFIASMPLVGYDGTMRRRLNGQTVAGKAHIKTGTLDDVRSVAGYVQAASGKYYVVAFLVNHPNAGRAVDAQDALVQWVYERG
ncbi:D-alanyl-D-alanine carboxypeptidase/D-alanyl-D-alanine-endopeptidase [Oxalobacteraceae bacterium OM1]|nr:D-alanyl-D-alanine carboxypeptidase/D-alanyl-D-alanine-endopeptidase [Oxalobacteraceae bacterium OM1]